jgi:hypothetical protein
VQGSNRKQRYNVDRPKLSRQQIKKHVQCVDFVSRRCSDDEDEREVDDPDEAALFSDDVDGVLLEDLLTGVAPLVPGVPGG